MKKCYRYAFTGFFCVTCALFSAEPPCSKCTPSYLPAIAPKKIASCSSALQTEPSFPVEEQIRTFSVETGKLHMLSTLVLSSIPYLQIYLHKYPQMTWSMSMQLKKAANTLSDINQSLASAIRILDCAQEKADQECECPVEQVEQEGGIVDRQLNHMVEDLTHAHAASAYVKDWTLHMKIEALRGHQVTQRADRWNEKLQIKQGAVTEFGQNYRHILSNVNAIVTRRRSNSCHL